MAQFPRRRGLAGNVRVIGAAVLVAALVAGGLWLWLRPGEGPPIRGTAGRDTAAAADAAGRATDIDTAPDLPPLAESDSLFRARAADLTAHPELSAWLAADSLIHRIVGATVMVASGRSPRSELGFLEPEGSFRVRQRDTLTVIDPASFRRYDPVAEAVAGLDPGRTARLYRRLRPLFQRAYRDLGFSEGSFDAVLARAIETLLAVPVPDPPIEVEPEGGTEYRFRDPELEALAPAQKHLLRMGPENARRIQESLRALVEALELPVIRGMGSGG